MDGLRWLLLFFGLLVIAGVYLYSRREKTKPEEPAEDPRVRREPTLEGGDSEPAAADMDGSVEVLEFGEEEQTEPPPEDVPCG
jgi:hypothetical protein